MKQASHPSPLVPIALAVCAALAAIHLARPVVSAPYQFTQSYVEGWNAYHAVSAISPERRLYPGPEALYANNYPPLSFYLVGGVSLMTGDAVIAGRAVNLLSLAALAAFLAVCVRRLTGSAAAAAFAPLWLVATLGWAFSANIGVSDPQLLAHACMFAGLSVLLRGATSGRIAAAVVLFAVGGLVKHIALALPLSVALWLMLEDRAAFRRLVVTAAIVGAIAGAALVTFFGSSAVLGLASAREYSFTRAYRSALSFLPSLFVALSLAAFAALVERRGGPLRLPLIYTAVSAVLGLVLLGGSGVNYNALYDLVLALSLVVGVAFARAGETVAADRGGRASAALALALCIAPAIAAPAALSRLPGLPERMRSLEASSLEDVAYLRLQAGTRPALCEALALCYWAGSSLEVDLFNARQSFARGVRSEGELLQRIRGREFAVVQLRNAEPGRADERVSPALIRALLRNYRVARRSPHGAYLLPRSSLETH